MRHVLRTRRENLCGDPQSGLWCAPPEAVSLFVEAMSGWTSKRHVMPTTCWTYFGMSSQTHSTPKLGDISTHRSSVTRSNLFDTTGSHTTCDTGQAKSSSKPFTLHWLVGFGIAPSSQASIGSIPMYPGPFTLTSS